MNPFGKRHQEETASVLSCFDRVNLTGTLPDIANAGAMPVFFASGAIDCLTPPKGSRRCVKNRVKTPNAWAVRPGLNRVHSSPHSLSQVKSATWRFNCTPNL